MAPWWRPDVIWYSLNFVLVLVKFKNLGKGKADGPGFAIQHKVAGRYWSDCADSQSKARRGENKDQKGNAAPGLYSHMWRFFVPVGYKETHTFP